MQTKIEVPFTNALRMWLMEIGYAHIFDKGADPSNIDSPYVLIPLRELELKEFPQEEQEKILKMDYYEVIDMANGDPFIRFVLEVPTQEFESYLKL